MRTSYQSKSILCLLATILIGCGQSDPVGYEKSLAESSESLEVRCQRASTYLAAQLSRDSAVLVATPLILGGDLTPSELRAIRESTIAPAMRSMSIAYSMLPIQDPITLLIFSDEAVYRRHAGRLFGLADVSVYGFYRPTERTIMVNLASGDTALTHELAHAMIDCDCEGLPVWLNEAIASLQESCDFTASPPYLQPTSNWRLGVLKAAYSEGALPSVKRLLDSTSFHDDPRGILYAHARYFAFFLHERGLLSELYGNYRAAGANSRTVNGERLLLTMLEAAELADVDRQFREWLLRRFPG